MTMMTTTMSALTLLVWRQKTSGPQKPEPPISKVRSGTTGEGTGKLWSIWKRLSKQRTRRKIMWYWGWTELVQLVILPQGDGGSTEDEEFLLGISNLSSFQCFVLQSH